MMPTKKAIVELDELVDALQESLSVISEQRSRNQVKKRWQQSTSREPQASHRTK